MIARVTFDGDGIVEAGFIPCHLDTDAIPVPWGGGDATVAYVERITGDAGLSAEFVRRGTHVTFLDRATTGERSWA
jgi:poly-gamma-glutamate synthesis protein (capsule biosynthesis protein)